MLSAEGLLMTFWPLKLLAGRVKIQFRSMRKELVNRMDLHKIDLGLQLVEAFRRFARCYFSHNRPSVGKSDSLEATRAIIYEEKLAELPAFDSPILTPDAWILEDFVKRMEWMEAEYLDHAEDERSWSLTQAWVETNVSPLQRLLAPSLMISRGERCQEWKAVVVKRYVIMCGDYALAVHE